MGIISVLLAKKTNWLLVFPKVRRVIRWITSKMTKQKQRVAKMKSRKVFFFLFLLCTVMKKRLSECKDWKSSGVCRIQEKLRIWRTGSLQMPHIRVKRAARVSWCDVTSVGSQQQSGVSRTHDSAAERPPTSCRLVLVVWLARGRRQQQLARSSKWKSSSGCERVYHL